MRKLLTLIAILLPLALMAQEEESETMQVRGNIKFVNDAGEKIDGPDVLWYGAMDKKVANEAYQKFRQFKNLDDADRELKFTELREQYNIDGRCKRGVFKKKNGKYLASIGFKKKVYYLGTFDDYDEAVAERLVWESLIHDGFVKARSHWVSMAAEDPEWARHNPFVFDLVKENGDLRIINSMENVKEAFGAPLQSSG